MKALLLYYSNKNSRLLSYNDDWLDAFLNYEKNIRWDQCNLAKKSWFLLLPRINKYELIVLLHSTNSNREAVRPILRKVLLHRKGNIIVFIGNEYKNIPQKFKLINDIDADFIASQLPQDTAEWLYTGKHAKIISVPHALNPSVFKPNIPNNKREIDIGERSYDYPWYLGDIDRNLIGDFFLNLLSYNLKIDVSHNVNKRFNRNGWANFLNQCKGTVATEAGTLFLERDDRTRIAINQFLSNNKSLEFEEVYKRFFADYKNPVSGKTISSRHFDAIGTKTCQIMFKGRFCDILVPEEHYIVLNKNFNNLDDVIKRFKDNEYRQKMVDRTYEYVMDLHTHKHRLKSLFKEIAL